MNDEIDTTSDVQSLLKSLDEKSKRRSRIIWSGTSIAGYIWDIIRNIAIIVLVLSIYNSLSDSVDIVVISMLIIIYLAVVAIGAQLSQSLVGTNIRMYSQVAKILRQLGGTENQDDKDDIEKAGFMLEKIEYKFILNSIFNVILFAIAFVSLLGAI